MKPGLWNSVWGSHVGGRGSRALAAFPGTLERAEWDPNSFGIPVLQGGDLICCTVTLAVTLATLKKLFNFYIIIL